jgi:hypothetical protein
MRTKLLIGTGLAVALAGAMWIYQPSAFAQGWGMMGGGYGPGYGHMGGWGGGPGPGAGFGPGNCPGFAQANEPGPGNGQGYGPGYHMRGWGGGYGPGMMRGYGYGPGNGPAYNRGDAQGNQTLNLTTDDVKARMERWLTWRANPRLKLGEIKEKDADSITADVVTKDNSLVERLIVDRHTGFMHRDNS